MKRLTDAERAERANRTAKRQARKATFKGIRALVRFLEANPQIEIPYGMNHANKYFYGKDAVKEMLEVAKGIKGKMEKKTTDSYFFLQADFGGGVTFDMNVSREQVCTKRVTGTKVIPGYTVPDQKVEVVEWDCPPALAALVAGK